MLKSSPKLILITSAYPYGNSETFLEPEIAHLSERFNEIIIVPEKTEGDCRSIPQNVHVLSNVSLPKITFLNVLSVLFTKDLWKEILAVYKLPTIKLSPDVFKVALKACVDARRWVAFLEEAFPYNPQKPTVFYTYWCDSKTIALCLMKKYRKTDRFITRLHGWDVYTERHDPQYLPFRKKIAKELDGLFFISENGLEYVKQKWQIFLPHNFYLSRLGTKTPLPFSGRESTIDVVSCSSVIPLKRVLLIAEAVISLKGKIQWMHIGDGPLYKELKEMVHKAGAATYIFLPGKMRNDQVHEIFQRRKPKVFINVSTTEGIPVSIMEAMSYGIPVLATAVGGTPEIVKNRFSGFLMNPILSAEELAGELTRFFCLAPETLEKMGQESANVWQKNYDAEKNYVDFSNLILYLVNGK